MGYTQDPLRMGVIGLLGKRMVVTDSPALLAGSVGNTLSLQAGGIIIDNTTDIVTNIDTSNGNTRIGTTFQADYSFGLGLKGYAWDTANGGKSPLDASIGTGTNWDVVVSNIKNTAGTLLIFDATA